MAPWSLHIENRITESQWFKGYKIDFQIILMLVLELRLTEVCIGEAEYQQLVSQLSLKLNHRSLVVSWSQCFFYCPSLSIGNLFLNYTKDCF